MILKRTLFFMLLLLNTGVFAQQSDSAARVIVGSMNGDSLVAYTTRLEAFGTRFATAPNHRDVAIWIRDKLIDFGYPGACLDSFSVTLYPDSIRLVYDTFTTMQYNVVAVLPGSGTTEEYILFGGHYDSFAYDSSFVNAPGADDNASGVAAMLETARVLKLNNHQPYCNLRFLAFGIEEFGLFGSFYDAGVQSDSGTNIRLMINNDMIAYTVPGDTLIRCLVGNQSQAVMQLVNQARSIYGGLVPSFHAVGFSSDYYPYNEAGYTVAGFNHHAPYPHYHKVTDLVDNCDVDYLLRAAKFACAVLLKADQAPLGIEATGLYPEIPVLYPNPFSNELTLHFSRIPWFGFEYTLTDLAGRVCSRGTRQAASPEATLYFPELQPGIYFLNIETRDGRFTLKAVCR